MKKKYLLIISGSFFFFSLLWRGEEIFAQNITVDSIIQTSPCAGSNIYIPYSVSGGNFNYGNVFTAQLSSPSGSFSNPTNIGSIPYWGTGMIVGTIPLSATEISLTGLGLGVAANFLLEKRDFKSLFF